MNKKSNYNSIVFLTTLSVYLGLVLVGGAAAPHALAQAAMTRDFDIKNEIEFKDDLDTKPDDEIKNLVGSIEDYFEDLEEFIEDLQNLHSIEKFDLDNDRFSISELGFVARNVDGDPLYTKSSDNKIDKRWLEPALIDAHYRFDGWSNFSDCFQPDQYSKSVSTCLDFKLKYDESALEQQITVFKSSAKRAEQLAANFNEAFRLYELSEDEIIVKELHKNTSFSFKDSQFLIITHLPRASIDELFARKVAQ